MSVPVAFLAVVLIWSTTPLAVKWSSEGAGFLPGALARMGLATLLCLALVVGLRQRLPWHREARYTYAASSLGVYGALLCVYWSAQYIPSGLIAVLFGLTPLVTGLFARIVLKERGLTPAKFAGTLLGLAGLAVIFGSGAALGHRAREGIEAVLLGVGLNAAGLVLVKRFNASLPSLATTTGTLLVATPLFLLTWLGFDGHWPATVPAVSLAGAGAGRGRQPRAGECPRLGRRAAGARGAGVAPVGSAIAAMAAGCGEGARAEVIVQERRRCSKAGGAETQSLSRETVVSEPKEKKREAWACGKDVVVWVGRGVRVGRLRKPGTGAARASGRHRRLGRRRPDQVRGQRRGRAGAGVRALLDL